MTVLKREGPSILERIKEAIVPDFAGTGRQIVSLPRFAAARFPIERLPRSLCILLETTLRGAIEGHVSEEEASAPLNWLRDDPSDRAEIRFPVGRILLQDAAGIPLLVDFAALRDAMAEAGHAACAVQPVIPVDLVVDHSVQLDAQGFAGSCAANIKRELERNRERYAFLRWAAARVRHFRVVPPGNGIVHQIHMEHLVEFVASRGKWLGFDTVIGTDSHTPMIGGLGVLGWGVGGIEAEAAMLGIPVSIMTPQVVGLRFTGTLNSPATASDVALSLTRHLRQVGVVGAFIEAFGPGCAMLTGADRATIANMAPEYGATCVLFPFDSETTRYMRSYGRSPSEINTIEAYYRHQCLFEDDCNRDAIAYTRIIDFDLCAVVPVVSGPSRPQDVVPLPEIGAAFNRRFSNATRQSPQKGRLRSGDIVIASITSCTNTANSSAMILAGLVARAAVKRGLTVPPHVRTSFAPGSRSVPAYLSRLGLLEGLNKLGFHVDAFGCATCVGNSGELAPEIEESISSGALAVAAVLSGNRNFEARIHPSVQANFLMSPALVVAFAIAGRVDIDMEREPVGCDTNGNPVHLCDLWPDAVSFTQCCRAIGAHGKVPLIEPDAWAADTADMQDRFTWSPGSRYFVRSPFFDLGPNRQNDIVGARPLLVLGDDITTDHISPVGRIALDSPAAAYLRNLGEKPEEFNTYASRRGHHEVMKRGTFANIKLKNLLLTEAQGPWSRHIPTGDMDHVHAIADRYRSEGRASVIVAGSNYGSGSARDWAAKGTRLLGVRAVLARSFERIHRSNLVFLGVAPIEIERDLVSEVDWASADIAIDVNFCGPIRPGAVADIVVRLNENVIHVHGRLRVDSNSEVAYFQAGGVLPFVRDALVNLCNAMRSDPE